MRIREDGDVEIVGSRIAAMSRGLFRLVGRVLQLNRARAAGPRARRLGSYRDGAEPGAVAVAPRGRAAVEVTRTVTTEVARLLQFVERFGADEVARCAPEVDVPQVVIAAHRLELVGPAIRRVHRVGADLAVREAEHAGPERARRELRTGLQRRDKRDPILAPWVIHFSEGRGRDSATGS